MGFIDQIDASLKPDSKLSIENNFNEFSNSVEISKPKEICKFFIIIIILRYFKK